MKPKKKKSKLRIVLEMVIIFVIAFTACNHSLIVRNYEIKNAKITSGDVKLLLITDLHSCFYGKNQEKIITEINNISPDVILLGGDIYDDKRANDGTDILLEYIGKSYKCYYVSGNHEYWSNNIVSMKSTITGYGITVLEGNGENLTLNAQNLLICGVDDPDCQNGYGESRNWYDELSACSQMREGDDSNSYSVLLCHRPERIEDYNNSGFDLVLCGHAHGGQWRIPYILNGLYAPNQGVFPKYAGGYYGIESGGVIVSRGLAISNIPRIFNRPELVCCHIKSDKE